MPIRRTISLVSTRAGRTSLFLAMLLVGVGSLWGASLLENPRDSLDRLRGEVDSLSTVLDSLAASERTIGSRINALDAKISARLRLIDELDRQRDAARAEVRRQDRRIGASEREIEDLQGVLGETEQHLATLEQQVAKRWVHLYKQGNQRVLAFLLSAEDTGDFLRRQVYVSRIHDRDESNLDALRDARAKHRSAVEAEQAAVARLREARITKQAKVTEAEQLVAEAAAERTRLEADRGSLQTMLASVQTDRESVRTRIEDRKAAMAEVEQWIANLEQKRITGNVQEWQATAPAARVLVRQVPEFASFSGARGKLPWPVDGSIVSSFGMERNRITGTLTENPGIDIAAREGSEVLAVQAGVCTKITYVRGFGTTLLLSHGDGYYTVYAHLASVWVGEGESIKAGRVLGTVGTSEDDGTSKLHFQVWHKQTKEDPKAWLSS